MVTLTGFALEQTNSPAIHAVMAEAQPHPCKAKAAYEVATIIRLPLACVLSRQREKQAAMPYFAHLRWHRLSSAASTAWGFTHRPIKREKLQG